MLLLLHPRLPVLQQYWGRPFMHDLTSGRLDLVVSLGRKWGPLGGSSLGVLAALALFGLASGCSFRSGVSE